MNTLAVTLLLFGGALLFVCIGSVYATTMTFRRSRVSPWAYAIGAIGLILTLAGAALMM